MLVRCTNQLICFCAAPINSYACALHQSTHMLVRCTNYCLAGIRKMIRKIGLWIALKAIIICIGERAKRVCVFWENMCVPTDTFALIHACAPIRACRYMHPYTPIYVYVYAFVCICEHLHMLPIHFAHKVGRWDRQITAFMHSLNWSTIHSPAQSTGTHSASNLPDHRLIFEPHTSHPERQTACSPNGQ